MLVKQQGLVPGLSNSTFSWQECPVNLNCVSITDGEVTTSDAGFLAQHGFLAQQQSRATGALFACSYGTARKNVVFKNTGLSMTVKFNAR
eukprot:362206-Chlamydomonas_euryale.AAC.3